jgi:hypothetical protein
LALECSFMTSRLSNLGLERAMSIPAHRILLPLQVPSRHVLGRLSKEILLGQVLRGRNQPSKGRVNCQKGMDRS